MSAAKGKKQQQQQQQQQGAKKTPVASPSASPAAKTSTPTPAAVTPAPAPAWTSAPAAATPTTSSAPASTSTKSTSKPSTPAQKGKPNADATNEGEEKKGARNNNMDTSSVRTDLTDTAAHILKGAIVSVLGKDAAITDSVNWKGANKGILNIRWSGDTIPQDTIAIIQTRANEIIRANLPIEHIQMERSVAEEKYSKEKVNHTYIYDAKEPPVYIHYPTDDPTLLD